MSAVPRSRRRSASRAWSSCCWCARRASPRCRCTSDVSTRPGKRPVWPPAASTDRRPPVPSRHTARRYNFGPTANTSSPPSRRNRRSCLASPSRDGLSPRWRRLSADAGSATPVAVAMMAVLLAITVACVYLGSAVIARHRAQAAADLAALAAAGRLTQGRDGACAHAVTLAESMHATLADCSVVGLDVVVAVEVPVALGRLGSASARAVARAGPVDHG
jgi:secretion/DNA translocation related TadE-like protein